MKAPSSIRIKNRSNKKQGFTLVELIVVIVIILILAAVLVPQLLRYVDRAQAAVCAENRHTVYIQVMATYTDGTHETLTAAFDALSDNEKEACPSGGDYSIVVADDGYSAEIVCSYHDEADVDGGDNNDTNDDENTSGGGDVVETPSDPSKEFMVGDYLVTVDEKLENYFGKSVPKGKLFYYNGDYYFSRNPTWLQGPTNITGSRDIVKLNPQNIVPESQARTGDLAIRNGQLFVRTANSGETEWGLIPASKAN